MQFAQFNPRDEGTQALPIAFTTNTYSLATSTLATDMFPKSVNIYDITPVGFKYRGATEGGKMITTANSMIAIGY